MSYVFTFLGFATLIILHEFGHFAAAKAVGMRVERFSLFFGPPIFTRRRGETEYRIGTIPLGGYVKITGMNPYEELDPDVAHRAYLRQPAWKRIVVIAAGPLVNVLIFLLLIFAILWSQGLQGAGVRVGAVEPGTPAAQTLRAGDRILGIDGVAGYRPGQSERAAEATDQALAREIGRHRCAGALVQGCRAQRPVRITVLRTAPGRALDSKAAPVRRTLTIYPRYDTKATPAKMRLGFAFGTITVAVGPGQAASRTFASGWTFSKATVSAITRIFYSAKARKQVSGVVGAYAQTQQTLNAFGWGDALQLLAVVSLSLAIVNLFPFLPLDGGHIFWAAAERIRGRAIPFRVIERASVVGVVLVVFIVLVGLTNDIGRLTGQGFHVR